MKKVPKKGMLGTLISMGIILTMLSGCPSPVGIENTEDTSTDDQQVTAGTIHLLQGDNPIDHEEHYDFGSVVMSDTKTISFTIENLGTGPLELTGDPKVSISGTDSDSFSV